MRQQIESLDSTDKEDVAAEHIQRAIDEESNFHEYDGGLLELKKEEYLRMYRRGMLHGHLTQLAGDYKHYSSLASARNQRDKKPILLQIGALAVTMG